MSILYAIGPLIGRLARTVVGQARQTASGLRSEEGET
jgi:hypothetical protein